MMSNPFLQAAQCQMLQHKYPGRRFRATDQRRAQSRLLAAGAGYCTHQAVSHGKRRQHGSRTVGDGIANSEDSDGGLRAGGLSLRIRKH